MKNELEFNFESKMLFPCGLILEIIVFIGRMVWDFDPWISFFF